MPNSSTRVRVGFIGVGSTALDHARAVLELGHSVVAGCGTNERSQRWKTFRIVIPEARYVSTIDALLEDKDIDAVVVCLPWSVTEGVLARLVVSPKQLLIEKPVALSAHALANVIALPDAQILNKTVGLNRRFYNTVQTLKERVKKGGLKTVEISISESVARLSQLFGSSIVPHILVYNSCHILDVAIYVLGELTPVKNYIIGKSEASRPFRSLFSLLETTNGFPVSLVVAVENPLPVGLRILFDDETTWHLSPMEQLNVFKGYKIIEPVDGVNVRQYIPRKILTVAEDSTLKFGILAQMKSFLEGRSGHIGPNLSEHIHLLKFIESLSVSL